MESTEPNINFQRESTVSGNEFELAVAQELADMHDLDLDEY